MTTASKRWEIAGWVIAALAWTNVAITAVVYMLYPGYVDHGESAISAMAWRMLHGARVYLPLDAPDRITNVYGPLTYLWHAWPLALFGGSIAVSKMAAALGGILIGPALFLVVRGAGAVAGWVLALLAGILTIAIAAPVVIRPDALLVLLAAGAVLAVARADRLGWRSSLILGLCAGLAVSLKMHAAVYLVPVGLAHLWGHWRRLPLIAGTAILTAGVFFLLPPFPIQDYLAWLGPMSAKENNWKAGWYWEVVLYLFPYLFLALGKRRPLSMADRLYLCAYAPCVLLVLFPATKVGGGSHYFLPFLPLAADLMRRLAPPDPLTRQKVAATVVALFALAGSYQTERRLYKKLEWDKAPAVTAEVEAILDSYADRRVQMGVGRMDTDIGTALSYYYYMWRNLPVYRGHPYTMDAGIMMEMTKLGIPFGDDLLNRIATCHTQIWLTPKGSDPFLLLGYYRQEVFPEAAHRTFLAHHRKIESRQFYDIWECHP